jgi:hypothetical protein|tara:strand:- start:1516 stop:2250 length:735 start_codon:yes stop_codon:yes gene_type:complete
MALPKIEVPTYKLTLPSEDTVVEFRPFLVKEEKILMLAMEEKNDAQMKAAVRDLINSCTFGKLEVTKLPLFDIEYLFLNIRAKSVGEIASFKVFCPEDKVTLIPVDVDLTKVEVQVDDEHTNKIVLDEERNLGISMNYPNIDTIPLGVDEDMNTEAIFKTIVECIDYIYEGEQVHKAKDSTKAELIDFFNNLNTNQFKLIRKFFDTMPKLRHEVKVINPKTKKESVVTLQGLSDFFVSASPTTT